MSNDLQTKVFTDLDKMFNDTKDKMKDFFNNIKISTDNEEKWQIMSDSIITMADYLEELDKVLEKVLDASIASEVVKTTT